MPFSIKSCASKLLTMYPGNEGIGHGLTLLTVFALAGRVTALMAEE